MATKAIDDYEKRGHVAFRIDDLSDRPAGGWQQKAYDRGVEAARREAQALDRIDLGTPTPSQKGLPVLRKGVLLSDQLLGLLSNPVVSHLKLLNDQYQKTPNHKRADRLLGSIGRILNRWLPKSGS